jgi:hypothetical protein
MSPAEIPSQTNLLLHATPERWGRPRAELRSLYAVAACLVVAATSWFLLKELGPLLRPIILAVLLAYLIVPVDQWLRRRIPGIASAAVIVGATLILFWGLAMLVYGNLVELNADMPRLLDRARRIVEEVREEVCSRQVRLATKLNRASGIRPARPCACYCQTARAFWPKLSSSAFTWFFS